MAEQKRTEPVYFHIDVNNAYLSWEAIYRMKELGETEDIRNQNAIIGGDISKRHGIVLAKSQSAKRYGIKTGEPVVSAMKKCPGLLSYAPHMEYYRQCSKELMELFLAYAPVVDQYSVDEAFLDMSGTYALYGEPVAFAHRLKDEIRDKLGFTVNVGISSNRLLAKMASDFSKPDKVHTLFPAEIQEKMWPLPVEDLFYVGHSTASALHGLGIHTIGDIAKSDLSVLRSHFKSHGEVIYNFANGIDLTLKDRTEAEQKGYGNSTTIPYDIKYAEDAYHTIMTLCESVCGRLRKDGMQAAVLSVEIKDSNFVVKRHQRTLLSPTDVTDECYQTACALFDELWDGSPIRLIGVAANKVTEGGVRQLNLFDMESHDKLKNLDLALDSIREKYGSDAVKRGSLYEKKK
ncbi:MAG: DNA polymerase IV [Bacteroidales bacterium]|nr:DNA polymerase IV [Clostridium sp.]MCM1203688.1 DNA polymerase IV [Bacteroidales bacterium]